MEQQLVMHGRAHFLIKCCYGTHAIHTNAWCYDLGPDFAGLNLAGLQAGLQVRLIRKSGPENLWPELVWAWFLQQDLVVPRISKLARRISLPILPIE